MRKGAARARLAAEAEESAGRGSARLGEEEEAEEKNEEDRQTASLSLRADPPLFAPLSNPAAGSGTSERRQSVCAAAGYIVQ